MAITAEFTADFSNFNTGVETASRKLQTLEQNSEQAAQSVVDWSQTLSTAAGFLGALGIDATVSGVINFTKAIFDSADALQRLHDQTGISVENLQRFESAAQSSGNSLDQVTDAITKMQENIGSGSKATVEALTQIGVPLADIRSMSADQQFIAIGEALAGIEDPATQTALAIDIFGKTGARILPLIKGGLDGIRDSAAGMSAATVKSLDDVGDALTTLTTTAKGFAGTVLGRLFFGWAYDAKAFEDQLKNIPKPVQNVGEQLKALTISTTEQANIERVLGENLKESQTQAKAYADALKAVRDVETDRAAFTYDWLSKIAPAQATQAAANMTAMKEQQVQYEAEKTAREQLNAIYGQTVTALDIYNQKLAALQTLQQKGYDTTERQKVAEKEYTDTLLEEAKALDAEIQAFWKARDAKKADTEQTKEATKETGVYMNQLHMLVDDPKLASFFGGNPVAATLYSGGFGETSVTPEEAAAMAAGQFINFAGFGSAQNQMSRISQNRAATVVNVTQPLGTPDAIARAVGDALGTRARGTGQRF